ncbi:MAG: hypothetical protein MRY83_09730 [Flavobacteriales bacterium]|nr:hypothetical protein [Flavobacteriales bacterium]
MRNLHVRLMMVILFLGFIKTFSQETNENSFNDVKVNLLFGLNQPLLGGFNIEGNLFYKRLAFDYSHGISLNFDNEILDKENQALGLDIHVPWTTGFGVGYRINDWLNLRAEPKWHKFELFHQNEKQVLDNLLVSYTTFTMGIGAYANLEPFKNQSNFLKGIMIAPSIRWWPRVSSSLTNDQVDIYSKTKEQMVSHEALEVGISNSPLILNMSVGYSFHWK